MAELAYERPQFFADVPPPPLLVGAKGDWWLDLGKYGSCTDFPRYREQTIGRNEKL